MSKLYSPRSSNASIASSETSETQSVEDINSTSRATKSWNRIKEDNANAENEIDSKKPPWRIVSLSTLPKADKNALLRAKLLDASRRLRVTRTSFATQTDYPFVKLVKEVNLDTQTDLIELKDIGILTDGTIALKKHTTGEFILTYSSAQMTDAIMAADATTQTLLPKLPGSGFFDVYFGKKVNIQTNADNPEFQFSTRERQLIKQISEIRAFKNEKSHETFSEDSLSETEENDSTAATVTNTTSSLTLLKPTLSSWYFEYDDENAMTSNDHQTRPWSSFASSDIDRRLAMMKLTPLCSRTQNHQKMQTIFDPFNYAFFGAIEDLIREANKLIDLAHEISALIKSNVKLCRNKQIDSKPLKPFKCEFASKKWLPIIEKQEKELEEKVRNLEILKMQRRRPAIDADNNIESNQKV